MRFAVLAAVVLAAFCFGDGTETQTDWSGGPGVPGPVTTFGTAFDYCMGIDGSTAGEISLILEHIIDETVSNPRWTDVGDIDQDGFNDVLLAGYSSDSLFWFENIEDNAEVWEKHVIAYVNGPSRVVLTDIDGDMDLDALVGIYSDDYVSWFENDGTGGTWTEHIIDNLVDASRGVVPEDIDGDGDMDVFGASYSDDYVCWWSNEDGIGTTWSKDTIGLCNGPRLEDAIDLDYDGDLDVCVGMYSADSLVWYENNGVGNPWTRHTIDSFFDGSRGGWFADFNGDSYIDVVAAAATADVFAWYENADNTGTVWTQHVIDTHDNPWMCNRADIDDDGDSDVMLCGTTEDISYWYENDGSGSFTRHTVSTNTDPYFIGAFDVDQDDVMELVSNSDGMDIAAYYDVISADGMLVSSILDAQEDAGWGTISWTNSGAGIVEFAVRSSDDSANMGDWSTPIITSGTSLDAYTTEGDNYIQYAAGLATDDVTALPVLEDVTITWLFVSIEETQGDVDSYGLRVLSGNPSTTAVLGVSIPESGAVDLSVFDLSGRIVNSVSSENMEAGSYQVTLDRLVPGTYFVRMNAGDFTATEKLVLIR